MNKNSTPLEDKKVYINEHILKEICHMPIHKFDRYGKTQWTKDGILVYDQQPHRKILAVAHLDYVCQEKTYSREGDRIYCPQLDDRLGVYSILHLLPKLGLEYDLLLTDNEERGLTTARHFSTEKEYNWVFEIDRYGDDVAIYQYGNVSWKEALGKYFPSISRGSFTDITELDSLGVCGVNIACGYQNNHSPNAYFSVQEYISQIKKFVSFYEKYKDVRFPYDPMIDSKQTYYYSDYSGYRYGHYDAFDNLNLKFGYGTSSGRYDNNSNYYNYQASKESKILNWVKQHNTIVRCPSCENDIFDLDRTCPWCGTIRKIENEHPQCSVCDAVTVSALINKYNLCFDCLMYYYQIPRQMLEIIEFIGDYNPDLIKEAEKYIDEQIQFIEG